MACGLIRPKSAHGAVRFFLDNPFTSSEMISRLVQSARYAAFVVSVSSASRVELSWQAPNKRSSNSDCHDNWLFQLVPIFCHFSSRRRRTLTVDYSFHFFPLLLPLPPLSLFYFFPLFFFLGRLLTIPPELYFPFALAQGSLAPRF